MIVALAGGVGGAKLAQGLQRALEPGELTVVVNTADDFDLFGLRICPDLDTVLYTLAGIANPETGWGIAGDTRATLDAIGRLGRELWFQLGDQDLATHILRTERLKHGDRLTDVIGELARSLGVSSTLLPMTDDPVSTVIETAGRPLAFQDYFVARRHQDEVLGVTFQGIEQAHATAEVAEAIAAADVIVICPSNPFVSIGPILAIPSIWDSIFAADARVIAVSPIIGGRAVKGPADRMLASLGHEVSAAGVSAIYHGLLDGMVIDHQDADVAARIEASGIRCLVTATLMGGPDDRQRLAEETLAFAKALSKTRAGAA